MFKELQALTERTVIASLENSNITLLRNLVARQEDLTGRSGENKSSQTRSVS